MSDAQRATAELRQQLSKKKFQAAEQLQTCMGQCPLETPNQFAMHSGGAFRASESTRTVPTSPTCAYIDNKEDKK